MKANRTFLETTYFLLLTACSPSSVVLLTTQLTLPDDVLKSLARLGVRMTTRPSECTHLLCPHLVRTEKFLCALTRAPFILSAKWATASAAAKKLLRSFFYLFTLKLSHDMY